MYFFVSADYKVKLKESEKNDEYLDPARELKKKIVERGSDNYTNDNCCCWCYMIIDSTHKPQHSNPNPNNLANQRLCIYSLTCPTPLIITHRLLAFLESLMPLKN